MYPVLGFWILTVVSFLGYTGSTTPRYDDNVGSKSAAYNTPGDSTSGQRRTPKAFADSTPLYDE